MVAGKTSEKSVATLSLSLHPPKEMDPTFTHHGLLKMFPSVQCIRLVSLVLITYLNIFKTSSYSLNVHFFSNYMHNA